MGECVFTGIKLLCGMEVSSGGLPEGRVGGYGHTRSANCSMEETRTKSGSPDGRFMSRSAQCW